jgi:hypothetical protein
MQNITTIRRFQMAAIAVIAGLFLSATAMAQSHGGGHAGGGGHAAGGGHVGGFAGGRGYGAYGGWHGGYGGWRGGYGWRGYGGWYGGWGWGLGYGLFFGALPLYYSTYWWDGAPYYYANDNYYTWNGAVGQYETVMPPPEVANQVGSSAAPSSFKLFAYPKNGQTVEQQSKDAFECQKWAAAQTGFDPTLTGSVAASTPGATAPPAAIPAPAIRQDYLRAQGACLEGRGYSVQ